MKRWPDRSGAGCPGWGVVVGSSSSVTLRTWELVAVSTSSGGRVASFALEVSRANEPLGASPAPRCWLRRRRLPFLCSRPHRQWFGQKTLQRTAQRVLLADSIDVAKISMDPVALNHSAHAERAGILGDIV